MVTTQGIRERQCFIHSSAEGWIWNPVSRLGQRDGQRGCECHDCHLMESYVLQCAQPAESCCSALSPWSLAAVRSARGVLLQCAQPSRVLLPGLLSSQSPAAVCSAKHHLSPTWPHSSLNYRPAPSIRNFSLLHSFLCGYPQPWKFNVLKIIQQRMMICIKNIRY